MQQSVLTVSVGKEPARNALQGLVQARNEAIAGQVDFQRHIFQVLDRADQIDRESRLKAERTLDQKGKKAEQLMQKTHISFKKRVTQLMESYNRRKENASKKLKNDQRDYADGYAKARQKEAKQMKQAQERRAQQVLKLQATRQSFSIHGTQKIRARMQSSLSKSIQAEKRIGQRLSLSLNLRRQQQIQFPSRYTARRVGEKQVYNRSIHIENQRQDKMLSFQGDRTQKLADWQTSQSKHHQKQKQTQDKIQTQHFKDVKQRRKQIYTKETSLGQSCTHRLAHCGVDLNPQHLTFGATLPSTEHVFSYSMTQRGFYSRRRSIIDHVKAKRQEIDKHLTDWRDNIAGQHTLITGLVRGKVSLGTQFQDRLGHSLVLDRQLRYTAQK